MTKFYSNFSGLAEVGGRGSGGRVPQPNDSNNVRSQYHSTAEGEGGGGPAAEFRSQMTKQKKAQGPPIILGMLGFRIICNPRIAKISNSHFAADGAGGGGSGG